MIEQKNGTQHSLDDLCAVLKAVAETGALKHVITLAKNEAMMASHSISHFKDSDHKSALLKLAEFSVSRSY